MVDIKFHCDENNNFHKGVLVRAFSYKDYSIEMHNHDFYEVNIVLSGHGTHCIESGSFTVKRGNVFVIPPMVAHAYINTENLEVYHILLQKDFISRNRTETNSVKGFLDFIEIEPFLRGNFSNAIFLSLSNSQLMQLETDLTFIDEDSPFSWQEFSSMKYHTIWKILYWFSGLLSEQIKSSKRKKEHKYEIQILGALEFIHKHYSEKITIDDLCKKSFMSRSTFIRSFNAICDSSPIDYLNNYRCKRALQMLNDSNSSRTEIAHSCGFYDLSHMERMLKK